MKNDFLKIKTRRELASYFGLPLRKFTYLVYKVDFDTHYKTFEIKKRSGGGRVIYAPKGAIRKLQTQVKVALEEVYKPRYCTHGYVEKRGIKSNSKRHCRKRNIIKLDIKTFFESINFGRVYGMFLAKPFMFSPEVATDLARICCYKGCLPTGASTSPVISNIICSKLDNQLIKFAKENRCYYTRYADDLTFSTNQNNPPKNLIFKKRGVSLLKHFLKLDQNPYRAGHGVSGIIKNNGFEINLKKTRLIPNSSRQIVAGVVVNKKPNVPKEQISQLKGIIHAWKYYGIDSVAERFFEKYDKKNRPPERLKPLQFEQIVIGKLLHVRHIKGVNSSVYKKLAIDLAKVSDRFKALKDEVYHKSDLKIRIFTEGKTDIHHLSSALKFLQKYGKFNDLKVDFEECKSFGGDTELRKKLESMKGIDQTVLTVGLFDNDVNISLVNEKSGDRNQDIQTWSFGLFSMTMPVPPHRTSLNWTDICIEMNYFDEDLKRSDLSGRRLYTRDEFNSMGLLHTNPLIEYPLYDKKACQLIDFSVYGAVYNETGITKASIALKKSDFAANVNSEVMEFRNIDFSGFEPLFERLEEIQDRHLRMVESRKKFNQQKSV